MITPQAPYNIEPKMINEYRIGSPPATLKPDIAAENPIYIYLSKDKTKLIHSQSLESLLNAAKAKTNAPLRICKIGLSFLLQSGVVPPPHTAYEGVYVLGAGHQAQITTEDNLIALSFSYEFPFRNEYRSNEICTPNEDLILEKLATATLSKINETRPSFLFHSAGKDSNSIALALAKAGVQHRFTLISHKSDGKLDESEISRQIAKQLGFRHQVIGVNHDAKENLRAIIDYFRIAPIPVLDSATLAYPQYLTEISELSQCNMIDGGGNDAYMSTPTSGRENLLFRSSAILSKFRPVLLNVFGSESITHKLTQTKAEWCGFNGFTYKESKNIYEDCVDARAFFNQLSAERKGWDNYDFKTDILTGIIASEMHIRKFRNAATVWQSNAILPFADKTVAEYIFNLPEKFQFDRRTGKNKIILRQMLMKKMQLDSDKIGKMGFSVNYESTLSNISEHIEYEITHCSFWNKEKIRTLYTRLLSNTKSESPDKHRSALLLHRLFLLSSWINHSIYLRK